MKILFLTPQLPYPTYSGGLVKTSKILRYLSKNHAILLACLLKDNDTDFIDDFQASLPNAKCIFTSINKRRSLSNLVKSYVAGIPLTVYRNRNMQFHASVSRMASEFDCIIVDHYLMGQYIPVNYTGKVILHQHNAEYVMWERFAENEGNFLKKIAARLEASRIKRYEKFICDRADAILAAPNDIEQLCRIGLDRAKFYETFHLGDEVFLTAPDIQYHKTGKSLLYIGTLTWEANIDGLIWFLEEIWPRVCNADTDVTFDIIGKNPDPRIAALVKRTERVRLLGFVQELEPFYNQARVFVSPLRFGSGIKVKVVNALYRGLPTVTTSVGAEGLQVISGKHLLISDDPITMTNDLLNLLNNELLWNGLRDNSRALMREKYTWDRVFSTLDEVIGCL